MKSIRIGAGLGFYGDNWEPVAASIERGGVQFIASDHLAELTRAWATRATWCPCS
jgi:hypothetical protein